MDISRNDTEVLRDLAEQYRGLCESARNIDKIRLWRSLNNGKPQRPAVWVNLGLLGGDIDAVLPQSAVHDEELAGVEHWLRKMLWTASIGDDRVFYPWYTVRAEMLALDEGDWGIPRKTVRGPSSRGWRDLPVLRDREELQKLKPTPHRVLNAHPPLAQRLDSIFGDIIPIHINRATVYRKWGGYRSFGVRGTVTWPRGTDVRASRQTPPCTPAHGVHAGCRY